MIARLKNQAKENLADKAYRALLNDCDSNFCWNGHVRQLAADNNLNHRDLVQGIAQLLENKRIEHYNGGLRIKVGRS